MMTDRLVDLGGTEEIVRAVHAINADAGLAL
jgi:hypothetical protein